MIHNTHSIVFTTEYVFEFFDERRYSNDGGIKGVAKVFKKNTNGVQGSQIYEGEVYVPGNAIQFTAQ